MLRSVSAATAVVLAVLSSCVMDVPRLEDEDWEELVSMAQALEASLGPAPEDRFECPYSQAHMKYNRVNGTYCPKHQPSEDDNDQHFDCDDYSFACSIWGQAHGIKSCQFAFEGYTKAARRIDRCQVCGAEIAVGGQELAGHAMNIVEYGTQYCMVEPQLAAPVNRSCCWDKSRAAITAPPAACLKVVCESNGMFGDDRCRLREAFCELRPIATAGELSFLFRDKVCDELTSCGFDARASAPDNDKNGIPDDVDARNAVIAARAAKATPKQK